jgi:predicted Holliday junction resolvase-like endonuclease
MNNLLGAFEEIQNILGICPCCGELFKLADAKLILPKEKPKDSLYSQLLKQEAGVARQLHDLEMKEAEFEVEMDVISQQRIEAGRLSAIEKQRAVDPYFSGRGVSPRTVKVLFHPVEHIVFHCINDGASDGIEFVSREPKTRLQETIVTSINQVVSKGNVEYHLLRIDDDGNFDVSTPKPRRKRGKSSAG